MRMFHSIEELDQAVGTHLGYSDWLEITQPRVDLFAEATGDHQWIHIDPARAATGPFGTTIAHGYLLLSLVPMFMWQVYAVEGIGMGINYGANTLRFPAPVPVGVRVRAGVELVSVTPASGGHQVLSHITFECEGQAKPVCVVDILSRLFAEPAID